MSYKSALVVQTLKKVGRENTDDHIINKLRSKAISNVYFFMLGNESQQKVKGFSEKEKIGNIEFKASENLITVDKVLNRAKDDLNLNDADFNSLLSMVLFEIIDVIHEVRNYHEF